MKIRTSYVSNSSSSSFVVLKDALSKQQVEQIINYEEWVKFFIDLDNEENKIEELKIEDEGDYYTRLEDRFAYYDDSPWTIVEYEDFIFGETSMDNFSMYDYLDYIKIDNKFYTFGEGYIYEPDRYLLEFIKEAKNRIRKNKIDKINDSE